MKTKAYNPYLPFWETVPDGEPHVFGNRLYIFGSHDARNGDVFCAEDYAGWSAPLDDLGNWRYEGVIYRKDQDPINGAPYDKTLPEIPEDPLHQVGTMHYLYAPDVAQGKDGKFYLYYGLDGTNTLSVAVSDTPAGKYEFLDYIRYEDGSPLKEGLLFDPAILVEESGNYLYYGFAPALPPEMKKEIIPGAMMVKLADDMHTVISSPICVANGSDTAAGTKYEAHPFFEASSIRKYGDLYYFVYSSLQGHELCYGTAPAPEGPFEYRGVIVSNGDIGYNENTLPVNYMGNNHGGLVEVNGKHYIFWHRQTHGTCFSRQGCADEVKILPDGTIPQIEITSCGLNGGPLPARGEYPSYIACHLTKADRSKVERVLFWMSEADKQPVPEEWPYITEEHSLNGDHGLKPFVYNMRTGAVCGFKYFSFDGEENELSAELRGKGTFILHIDTPEGQTAARIRADADQWNIFTVPLEKLSGVHALYFETESGTFDFAGWKIR